eukprot:TRINITY_DN677_c0_g1_i1.p2 TRINITY_DN677_c0_g1~~TRINITY_DN677_c0_g1_i1.p2  ORF type:complete len:219 (+),score=20.66 TRINITY_DN677_c0_g1_i1:27-683(+)
MATTQQQGMNCQTLLTYNQATFCVQNKFLPKLPKVTRSVVQQEEQIPFVLGQERIPSGLQYFPQTEIQVRQQQKEQSQNINNEEQFSKMADFEKPVLTSVESLQSTVLEILEQQLNGERRELAQWFGPTTMAWLLLFALMEQGYSAAAQESIAASGILGITPQQIILAVGPLLAWAVFVVYRTSFNPKAKISTYLLTLGAVFIIGNVLTSIIFKVRLF